MSVQKIKLRELRKVGLPQAVVLVPPGVLLIRILTVLIVPLVLPVPLVTLTVLSVRKERKVGKRKRGQGGLHLKCQEKGVRVGIRVAVSQINIKTENLIMLRKRRGGKVKGRS